MYRPISRRDLQVNENTRVSETLTIDVKQHFLKRWSIMMSEEPS